MSDVDKILNDFPEEVESIIKNDCFSKSQQEALLDLSKQIYYCLNAIKDKNN